MDVLYIRVEKINIPPRLRQFDPAQAERIAASIKEIGLKQPISVRLAKSAVTEDGEIIEDQPLLVAGRHRLEALRLIGHSHAPCIEITDDALLAELWEIDENLIRSELSPAQKAQHLSRRKEIWESLKTGTTGVGLGGRGNTSFAAETASVAGISKGNVNEHIARAHALGDDIGRVAGTSLDKGVELDALARMPEPQRVELIDRAQAGERVSARDLTDFAVNESRDEGREWADLERAWNRARVCIRQQLLDITAGSTDALE